MNDALKESGAGSFKAEKWVLYSTLVLFTGGVILFAALGIYNRYWADDYCYNMYLKNLGLAGTLQGYTYITTYASNRISLTLFSGLSYSLGILGVQLLTPLAILTWLAGMYLILDNLSRLIRLRVPGWILLMISSALLYFVLYTTPQPYQSLYWRSGLLPYTAPLAMCLLLFGLILTLARKEKASKWVNLGIFLMALVAGGFSEAGNAVLTSSLALYLVAAWIGKKRNLAWANNSFWPAVIGLAGSLLAMGLLIFSPTSEMRMGRYGEPAGLLEFPGLLLTITYHFIRLSLLDLPLPHLAMIVIFAPMGFLIQPLIGRKITLKWAAAVTCLVLLIGLVVILASFAPSAYIEKVPAAPRTRIIPRFYMLSILGLAAGLGGYYLRQVLRKRFWVYCAAGVLTFGLIYSARSVVQTGSKIELFSDRARIWDQRDAEIRSAVAAGQSEVHVLALDSLPVGGINDLKAKSTHWINSCAERYYGIDQIFADLE